MGGAAPEAWFPSELRPAPETFLNFPLTPTTIHERVNDMATTATTTPAADLEPGDRFILPSTGILAEFVRWGKPEDNTFVFVYLPNVGNSSARHLTAAALDPSDIVNLEA